MHPSLERFARGPYGSRPVVGLVVDRPDWHARELIGALSARGVETVPVCLHLCGIATGNDTGLHVDGFGNAVPGALVVRTMSGGTFEAVTLQLGVLHALRELGVTVWNDARTIERCVDKSMTSFLLSRAGIPTPATWATESYEQAYTIAERETAEGALVLKPLFGSQGRGLRLIHRPEDLPIIEQTPGRVYYLQRFIGVERDGGYHDFRILVVQGRITAAMRRHSNHWITNIKRGGRAVPVVVNDEMKALALQAAVAVGANFVGVDIVYGTDDRPAVLEVNSMPAWSGLQKVTSVNIASTLADALLTACAGRGLRGAMA
jgi:tetrahydromethanopterin:alpha-L-glutamate ligase